ncbi:MAG: L-threonylcarbamoyladenylate synthase [Candidatus Hydrogenedentota bacterium]
MTEIYMVSEILDKLEDFSYKLKDKEIGVFPTDTIYGILGRADREDVINRVFELKRNRDKEQGFIILTDSIEKIEGFIGRKLTKIENMFAKKYWPGRITLILEKCKKKYKYVSVKDSQAFRIPDFKPLLRLLKLCDFPVIAPSANAAGDKGAGKIENVIKWFKNKIDWIVIDNDRDEIPSSIVKIEKDTIRIIRDGVLKIEENSICMYR